MLPQQQSMYGMHSMVRTASGAQSIDAAGLSGQGKRPGVKRQGSSGVSLEASGSLQSMLTPVQGMFRPCCSV